jgi:hypothetical protein
VIEQRGPHEAIIASSALKGTPDMLPDCNAERPTIDPRSENKMGNVMYKKTSPLYLDDSASLDDVEDTVEASELTWEVLRTHFQKAWVTTEEFGGQEVLIHFMQLLMHGQQSHVPEDHKAQGGLGTGNGSLRDIATAISSPALIPSLFHIRTNTSSSRFTNTVDLIALTTRLVKQWDFGVSYGGPRWHRPTMETTSCPRPMV